MSLLAEVMRRLAAMPTVEAHAVIDEAERESTDAAAMAEDARRLVDAVADARTRGAKTVTIEIRFDDAEPEVFWVRVR